MGRRMVFLGFAFFFISVLLALSATVHFGPAQNYPVGKAPAEAAVADFNGDGKPDLVVPNLLSGSISVFLGNGKGSFKAAQTYSLIENDGGALGTPGIVAADFNGDHKMDIAVVNPNRQSVDVLIGNGDGTFGRGPTLHLPDVPFAIVAADFNGDGKIDLAVTSVQSPDYTKPGKISVFLGNGNGTFVEPPKVTTIAVNPLSIGTADFDEDGKLDVVTTTMSNAPNGVQVLFGNGDGTFGRSLNLHAGTGPSVVAVGRFSKSRHLGFAVLANTLTVFLGNGKGAFTSSSTQRPAGFDWSLAVADFDRDGIDDVAIGVPPGTVQIMLSDGHGHLSTAASVQMGLNTATVSNERLVAADLNGDHYPDLVGTTVPSDPTKCFIAVAINQR